MTDDQTVELLPCPFCGGEPHTRTIQDEDLSTHNIVDWHIVECINCDVSFSIPDGYDCGTASEQWNTRAAISAMQPALAEAEAQGRSEGLRAAYSKVSDCVQAAYAEGLADRLADQIDTSQGSLHDLVLRRLLYAGAEILALIDTETDPQPDLSRTSEPQASAHHIGDARAMAEFACCVIDANSQCDESACCDGRECGCGGETVHEHMKAMIRAMAGIEQEGET